MMLVWLIFTILVLGEWPVIVLLSAASLVFFSMKRHIIAGIFLLLVLIGLTADVVVPRLFGG